MVVPAEIRDSAGIRIVESGGELRSAGELYLTELWRHGFDPGDHTFQHVFDGVLLDDGSALVVDMGASEVVQVSAEAGAKVRMPRGQGPSEVTRPIAVALDPSGGVWVDDDGNGRLVLLGADSVLRSVSTEGRHDRSLALRLRGVDQAGRLLMSTSAFSREFEGEYRMVDLVRLDPDDLAADTVGGYRAARRVEGNGRNPFLPYGASDVADATWVVAWSGEPEVRWLGGDGRTAQIARWVPSRRTPDAGELERYRAWLGADLHRVNPGLPEAELEALVERSLAQLEVDESSALPLFRDLIGSDTGHVWIEGYAPGTLPTPRFTVLGADGTLRGRVDFGEPVQLLGVRGDRVLAVVRDQFDVQGVAVFRVDTQRTP